MNYACVCVFVSRPMEIVTFRRKNGGVQKKERGRQRERGERERGEREEWEESGREREEKRREEKRREEKRREEKRREEKRREEKRRGREEKRREEKRREEKRREEKRREEKRRERREIEEEGERGRVKRRGRKQREGRGRERERERRSEEGGCINSWSGAVQSLEWCQARLTSRLQVEVATSLPLSLSSLRGTFPDPGSILLRDGHRSSSLAPSFLKPAIIMVSTLVDVSLHVPHLIIEAVNFVHWCQILY